MRFDEVLPKIVEILNAELYASTKDAIVVRDVSGIVSVVLPDVAIGSADKWTELAKKLNSELGKYSPGIEQVLIRQSDLIDPEGMTLSEDKLLWNGAIGLIDKVLTNQDWLRAPIPRIQGPKLAAAFSIKGGVGRSTAFAVLAWHFAQQGKHALVVDLDLEAPGIANMLLDEPQLPDYGLTDWLAESLVGNAGGDMLNECIAPWPMNSRLAGRVSVLPALGRRSDEYVSKLGRVYVPTAPTPGTLTGFADRISDLLSKLGSLEPVPDVILLDARAGLHDIGSAIVTRFGAEVFLFARDDPQTWMGYHHLFSHLKNSRNIHWGVKDNDENEKDLRWKLKMVAAQADSEERARQKHVEASYLCWLDLYDEEQKIGEADGLSFSRDDISAPHYPLFVEFDPRIRMVNLQAEEHLPAWDLVRSAFSGFIDGAEQQIFSER